MANIKPTIWPAGLGGLFIPTQNSETRVLEKGLVRFFLLFCSCHPYHAKSKLFFETCFFTEPKIKISLVIYSIFARYIIFSWQGCHFLLDHALDVPHSQSHLPFSFGACNPHRDHAIDVPHSQLELLFSFRACNTHRDHDIDVPHSQLELLFSFWACNPRSV